MTYTVKPGDTLSGIAQKFGVTLAKVMEVNPSITNPDKIYVGQVIQIPEDKPTVEQQKTDIEKALDECLDDIAKLPSFRKLCDLL